jgi:hypothetical protein
VVRSTPPEGEGHVRDYAAGLKTRDAERYLDIVTELKAEESTGLAALSVAARELSSLADRIGRGAGQEDRR